MYRAIDMNYTKHKTALDNSNSLQSALNLYSESLILSHHSKTLDIMTKTKLGIYTIHNVKTPIKYAANTYVILKK